MENLRTPARNRNQEDSSRSTKSYVYLFCSIQTSATCKKDTVSLPLELKNNSKNNAQSVGKFIEEILKGRLSLTKGELYLPLFFTLDRTVGLADSIFSLLLMKSNETRI
jgi:hypothetical protein